MPKKQMGTVLETDWSLRLYSEPWRYTSEGPRWLSYYYLYFPAISLRRDTMYTMVHIRMTMEEEEDEETVA